MMGVTGRRVLVVEDHPIYASGLRMMLDDEPWVDEVVEARTADEAVREVIAADPAFDVIAMDIDLGGGGDGVEATRRIVHARPSARVLMLTMHDAPDVVNRAVEAGARGFCVKSQGPETLLDALRAVASGIFVLGPSIQASSALEGQGRQSAALPPPFNGLTSSERRILEGLANGDTNGRIARHLRLSEKTVRNQVSRILAKLGVSSRVQAALLAQEAGITKGPPPSLPGAPDARPRAVPNCPERGGQPSGDSGTSAAAPLTTTDTS